VDGSGPGGFARRPAAVVAWIGGLCEQGVRASGVDGAGVSVIATSGGPQPVMSTDDRSSLIEDLQFTLGEGPCFDATSHRSPILISDLTACEEGVASRWPAFLNEAVAAGVRAVFAFPLGVGATTVGTLDLYRSTPGPLSEQQLNASLVTADSIGVALLSEDSVETLEQSGRLRMTVHQAAGMVMVQTGRTIGDALLMLRATAYGEGRSINDLAADVLAGRRRYDKEES
jgi:GAF domain-containing protein